MKQEICIIGVGRFGSGIINELKENSRYQIIAIDTNQEHLKVEDQLKKYYIGDATDEGFLKNLALDSVDIFIVGIGDNIQNSLLISSILKTLFPKKRIISKAVNSLHERILKQIGIKEIVNPERAAAKKAMVKILNPLTASGAIQDYDFFEIDNTISLVKIPVPTSFFDKRIHELNIPKGISIALIYKKEKKKEKPIIIDGDTLIEPNDEIVLIGQNKILLKFIESLK